MRLASASIPAPLQLPCHLLVGSSSAQLSPQSSTDPILNSWEAAKLSLPKVVEFRERPEDRSASSHNA